MPVIPDIGSVPGLAASGLDVVIILVALANSLALSLVCAWVYKITHRGLSYSQSFQFALVLLGVLGAVVMMIASGSILRAIGILGAFSLIRFRTAIKDPKDMAFILLVLTIGLASGAQMYILAILSTIVVCAIVLVLTWTNFGISSRHESVVRLMYKATGNKGVDIGSAEALLEKLTDHYRLLSAHTQKDRMELTFGIRPRSGSSALAVLEALRKDKDLEDAEIFDAKHQIEF